MGNSFHGTRPHSDVMKIIVTHLKRVFFFLTSMLDLINPVSAMAWMRQRDSS